jgi:type IV pilus assembly protein PilB
MRISDSLAQSLLKQSGAFTQEQLDDLRSQLSATKKPLQDLIIQNGLLSEAELTRLYAERLGVPFIELPDSISHRVLSRLPEHVATRYNAVVFDTDDNEGSILVAMEDPNDPGAVSFLKKQLGDNLKLHLSTSSQLRNALDLYRTSRRSPLLHIMSPPSDPSSPPASGSSAIVEGSVTVDSVNHILEQALEIGASDIHIEPQVDHIVIRYRIDGLLRPAHKLHLQALDPLLGYIKTMGQLKPEEHDAPQYGQWATSLGDESYEVRATILPTIDGEKVVLHLVPSSSKAPSLRDLGLWGQGLHDLQRATTEPHGILLVAGPTGSGKSTTLFSLLSALSAPNVTIATIEDPVEYRIAGANQVQIDPGAGVTLDSALNAVLQQSPNIIMLSEINDARSCAAAIEASLRGHLVLGALHTNNAAAGVRRLLDMDIKPHMITSSVRAIVGQRLARKLCPDCREAVAPSKATLEQIEKSLHLKDLGGFPKLHELESLAAAEGLGVQVSGKSATAAHSLSSSARGLSRLWRAHAGGCERCYHTGYQGRVGIFEVLSLGAAVQKTINSESSGHAIDQAAIGAGMISMQLDGLVKALRGQTTVAEVLRVST